MAEDVPGEQPKFEPWTADRVRQVIREYNDGKVEVGPLPGTYFCPRCDRNRWFIERSNGFAACAQCGGSDHELAAPGGLNPTPQQLAAMRRKTDHA